MTILLAGGGSGGHILPNIALLQELRKHHPDVTIVYCGEKAGMEEQMMQKQQVPFYGIAAGKMRRYFSLQNIADWFKIPMGIFQAWNYMLKIKPSVVFSKGGYVSVPVVIAAWMARVPVVIHESDVRPGLATRICSKFATKICVSWEETKRFLPAEKTTFTGVPIRQSLLEGDAVQGRTNLGITNSLPLLIVAGGSLGAADLNTFIQEQLSWLLQQWNVYHLAGSGKMISVQVPAAEGTYVQREFDSAMENALAAADIIFSRAGTTALAEYAALEKKVILVPLPLDRSRGDQIDNAAAYAARFPETTRIIPQEELSRERLEAALKELYAAPAPAADTTKATEQIASLLLGY